MNLNAGFFLFSCIFAVESYGVFSFRFGVAALPLSQFIYPDKYQDNI